MRTTLWLIRKSAITTFRDYKRWLLYLVIPVLGIVLASLIYGGSDTKTLKLGIVNDDYDQSLTGDAIQFIAGLEHVQLTELEQSAVENAIVSGEQDAVVRFPSGFAQSLKSGEPLSLSIASIKGAAVTAYVDMYLNGYIANIAAIGQAAQGDEDHFDAIYGKFKEAEFSLSTASAEDRSASNSITAQSIGYLLILMLVSAVSLSAIMIKDKEYRTYHRLLCAPVTGVMYTASNVMISFIMMSLQIAVTLVVLIGLFGMDPGIPVWMLLVILLLFALVAIGLSLMIVAIADSSMKANALQNLVIMPTSLLAGCMFPVDTMPETIQKIGDFLPQRWLLDAVDKLQQGGSLDSIVPNLTILLSFALTFSLIAAYAFGRGSGTRSYY